MANEITTAAAAQVEPAREITGGLFREFVEWIDRSPATTRAYIINLRQFGAWMKEAGVQQPQRADIIAYRDSLTAKGLKPSTISAYLRSVRQFFAWAAANGYYPDIAANIHAPKVDRTTHKKDCLTADEVLAIEESITDRAGKKTAAAADAAKDRAGRMQRSTEQGKRLYAMYLLAVNAGLRTVEISRANVRDLEAKGGQTWLYVWGKGHTEPDQKKAIAPEVAEAIRDYLDSRKDHPTGGSPLFVSTGNRSGGKRIATTTISTMLKRAMQAAGYDSDRLTAHSLRHTAGTAVQEITGDIYKTQQYMRHSNPATTEIYLHNDTEKQEAQTAQQLYKYYHGQQETDAAAQLAALLQTLTPSQLAQITGAAAAMAAMA